MSPLVRTGVAAAAMFAFAANSVLTRLALAEGDAGAWTFTAVRVGTGALVLAFLMRKRSWRAGRWSGAASLLGYVVFFSYAYLALGAGAGALILFAVVQITMVGWGLRRGERLSFVQWGGLLAALSGLVWLLSPGIDAPHPLAGAAMALAGVAWGVYSLLGRGAAEPTAATAGNFLRAAILVALASPVVIALAPEPPPSLTGLVAAAASGGLASGLGYALWYAALPALSRSQAGVLQLTVPALAAAGGVLFLAEPVTLRLALASLIIIAGVGAVMLAPARAARPGRPTCA